MKTSIDLQIKSIMANGDCAVIVAFQANKRLLVGIHALALSLMQAPLAQQINVIPATHNLTLVFANKAPDTPALRQELTQRCDQLTHWDHPTTTHQVQVCYDPQVAPDLSSVAQSLSVSIDQIIDWHTQPTYLVAMLGFLPGFAYLNGNAPQLSLPRKTTPAIQVPAGSVAIAGNQTGLYALNSPGGWHVIGRTPMTLLDWHNKQRPNSLHPLDRVQFQAIDLASFQSQEPG